MKKAMPRDRYVSFERLECDHNASQFLSELRCQLSKTETPGKWVDYFQTKLSEQQRMATDDLFFVGSQMNALYAFIEELGHEALREQLYQIEQECC